MSTTQRLGIDIVGTDKTRAAFTSAQRSLGAFSKTVAFATGALAGIAGGNMLKNVVQSFIQINKHVEPVKKSFTQIDRAWQQFALNVGKGGMNDALINFNERIATMIIRLRGLSDIIGASLGGAIDSLTILFEGVGRTAAFATDNIMALGGVFKRAAEIFRETTGQSKNIKVFNVDEAVLGWLTSMGVKTDAFTQSLGNNQAALAKLPPTFAEIEAATKKGEPALEKYRRGMVDLKQYVIGLGDQTSALGQTEGALARLTQSQAIYNKMQDQGVTLIKGQREAIELWLDKIPDAIAGLEKQKSAMQTAKDIGESFKSTFSSAFSSIVDGTSSITSAFKSMVSSLLSSLVNLFANKAFAMLIEGGPGSGGTGGLIGALFKGFSGGFASGGTLGAGKWGIAGENGPEPIVGPATVIPNRGMGGAKFTLIDQRTNAPRVETRQDSMGNLTAIIRDTVNNLISSGQTDKAQRTRFGAAPAQARRG